MELDKKEAQRGLLVASRAREVPTHAPRSQVACVGLMGIALVPAAVGTYWSFRTQHLAWVWLGFAVALLIIITGAMIGYRSRHTGRGFAAAVQTAVSINLVLLLLAGTLGLLHGPSVFLLVILAAMLVTAVATAARFGRTLRA